MLTLTFHGHACFTLEADGRRVIIDPFLTGNPATDIPLARLPKIDAVLLSHGHGDHLGDAIPIAREFSFGRVKLVPAFHGGAVEGDATGQFTTNPCGVVVTMGGRTVYHCGDTGLTMEMQPLAGRVDAMLVAIGDNYTMGVEDAVRAVEFVQPRAVIPMHYGDSDALQYMGRDQGRSGAVQAPGGRARPRRGAGAG